MATNGLYGNSPNGATVAAPGAATSGLYGSGVTGQINQVPGAESVGLYGHSSYSAGSSVYFEYFVFQDALNQPATPTGGSWDFTSNTGTPPAGWSNIPPSNIVNRIWVSIALVNSSQTGQTLTWSVPGTLTSNGSLPEITSGTGTPTGTPATVPALYIKTSDETLWAYTSQVPVWTPVSGGSGGATYLYQLQDVSINETGQTWTPNLLSGASRSISDINDQQILLNGTANALNLSIGDRISSQNTDTNATVVVTGINGNTITCQGGGIYALWSSPSGIKQFVYKYGVSVLASGRNLTWNGTSWVSSGLSLSSSVNTLTLTTILDTGAPVTTTAPIVNTVGLSFDNSTDVLTMSVNGVSTSAAIPAPATTNTLTNTTNTITSVVNGVQATAPAVNTVALSSGTAANTLKATVNGVNSADFVLPATGISNLPLDVVSWVNDSGVEYVTDTSIASQTGISLTTLVPVGKQWTINAAAITGFTSGAEIVLTDTVGRTLSGIYTSAVQTGLPNAVLDAVNWDRSANFQAGTTYTGFTARQGKPAVASVYVSTPTVPQAVSTLATDNTLVTSFPNASTAAFGINTQAETLRIDAEIAAKIGSQAGSLATFVQLAGVQVNSVSSGGPQYTGLNVNGATNRAALLAYIQGLGWTVGQGSSGAWFPGASSGNLYVSNGSNPPSGQYVQVLQVDAPTSSNDALILSTENDYFQQTATYPFNLYTTVVAANFEFQAAPNEAIRILAANSINVGTGLSKAVSSDGTTATLSNTGVISLNGLNGAPSLTSSDNTVTISTNSTTNAIDLKAHTTSAVAGEVTAYNTGPVTQENISYQIGVTGASNGAAIYIGTGTAYSTNESVIKSNPTIQGYTFGGQKVSNMVSSFGTGQQEFTVTVNGTPSVNVNLIAAFGDSTIDGGNTPFFRRRNGGNLANPITFAAPGLPFTVNGTTVTLQYDYTLEPAGGAIPKVGEAMNFLTALDGAIPLNYNVQIIAVSLVSGTTYSITVETFRSGNTAGHLGSFIVYHDQFPAYVSGSQAYSDLLPLNGQSPTLYTEYLPVGNTGLTITSIQQFQYGPSNSWYATIVFASDPQVTNVGFTNIDFSGSGINIPGAGLVTNLYSDTNYNTTNHSIIVRMPAAYSGGAVTFTGITASIWAQSGTIPVNTAMGTGGKIRWNLSPATWYIDSALQPTGGAGNYGNPWQFGFYLPPATGFGDFCLGWDITLDSSIPIQSVLYTNAGINGFWNNRHAINGASLPASIPTLNQVLVEGNSTGGRDIVVSNGDDITVATAAQLVISDGSQGQVLGKTASGTGWVNPPSGTITGVTAGVGLTGGGTTGNVTVALAPPTAVNIGGVKAGTNITIAVDGTISASGGGTGGGVTSVGTGYRLTGGPITSTGTVTYVRTWADYCGTWTTSPDATAPITGTDPNNNPGVIYTYVGPWGTYFRFIPDTYSAINDAFYSTLTGSVVSDLITRRNY